MIMPEKHNGEDNTGVKISGARIAVVVFLLAVVIISVIGHFIVRPDRSATLHIVYTGDIRGQISFSEGSGAGYGKISGIASAIKADDDSVILVDAGNCLAGSVSAETDGGREIINIMNAAGYDALLPADMDFMYGVSEVQDLRTYAQFPFLAANVVKSDGSNMFETYIIRTVNEVRVGIIGVSAGLSDVMASSCNAEVLDPVKTVEDVAGALSDRTDAIIVLAYTGDDSVTEAIAAVDGVNVVIESGRDMPDFRICEDGTVICSAGQSGKAVGVITLKITSDKVDVVNEFKTSEDYAQINSVEAVDAAVNNAVNEWALSENTVSGRLYYNDENEPASDPDTGDDASLIHNYETATGDIVADALLNETSSDGAVAALVDDTAIGGDMGSGYVTLGDIASLFDEQLYIVTCQMTGGEIRSVIENSFSGYPEAAGFLQVSGISYNYSTRSGIGSHLSDMEINGTALDDAGTYTVAMTSSLADKLGYESYASGRVGVYRSVALCVSDYISISSPLQFDVSGSRIRLTG